MMHPCGAPVSSSSDHAATYQALRTKPLPTLLKSRLDMLALMGRSCDRLIRAQSAAAEVAVAVGSSVDSETRRIWMMRRAMARPLSAWIGAVDPMSRAVN